MLDDKFQKALEVFYEKKWAEVEKESAVRQQNIDAFLAYNGTVTFIGDTAEGNDPQKITAQMLTDNCWTPCEHSKECKGLCAHCVLNYFRRFF